MRNFKIQMEELGYTFQSSDVLEDVYEFYRFYNNPANKGVTSILLEGDPGCGKTFLSEVFFKFLGKNAIHIYTQCVEETNSDRLIATYNVPAIVKGDADKSIAEGILTKAINEANAGKQVLLTIDELDKAREVLDSYFLDFLQSGRIETSDNDILSLTEEGRKILFVIIAKNNERNLSDALLRRCSVIKLPPMPPVLAYKTLLRNFENAPHDAKFLKFICKVYEAIYNEQMASNETLLKRLPALQELTTAITADYDLYQNGISSTRRISKLVRKLGKDTVTRETITDILVKKFKYQNQDSNYNTETLDLDMTDPEDYMSKKDSNSLIEQYIEKKDNGEEIFDEDEVDDPMSAVANILDNMKDDKALVFLDKDDKEKIVELGTITHDDPKALKILFDKIRFRGNPNSRFGFLEFEGNNFIGLMKYKNSLILIANKEYVSPRLFIRGLSTIITIIYDQNENFSINKNILNGIYFSPNMGDNFKLTGLNAKILSHVPNMVLNRMKSNNGRYVYQAANLKITYDEDLNSNYFRYLQKYKAEPLFDVITKICMFNPELAIPASFINAKKLANDISKVKTLEEFNNKKTSRWRDTEEYKYEIEDFPVMKLRHTVVKTNNSHCDDRKSFETKEDDFVFAWKEKKDIENKVIKIYPKYTVKNGYLIYTDDEDFFEDEGFKQMDPFNKEIALLARDIFGNFVPIFDEYNKTYFSSLTMSKTGRIVEDENNRSRIDGIYNDITIENDFTKYYDSISNKTAVITPNKVRIKGIK